MGFLDSKPQCNFFLRFRLFKWGEVSTFALQLRGEVVVGLMRFFYSSLAQLVRASDC